MSIIKLINLPILMGLVISFTPSGSAAEHQDGGAGRMSGHSGSLAPSPPMQLIR
jgi:hypothetical protein